MEVLKYETGPLCVNTYICFDENSKEGFIVDPGGESKKLIDAINDNSVIVNYIILTHGHADHIGGIEYVKKFFPNAKLICYKDEVEMLSDGKLNSSHAFFGRDITPIPDMLVSDGEKLKIGNIEFTFIHTPGHTKGGMCIYTPGILFTGDTLFRYSVGRTDFYGGSMSDIVSSIKNKLFKLPDDTICYPGHDQITKIIDEKKGNPFV